MEKYGFVYIWRDRKRNMYYIGCHWGTEHDGYVCSSNRMRDAYRRRPEDFRRRILKKNIPRESLLEEEFKWLYLIPDDQLGKKYYNLYKKHFGHWANNPDSKLSVGEKLSKLKLGRPGNKHTEESKQKIRNARAKQNPPSLGHKHSEETKQKMKKPKPTRSSEHCKKISDAKKGLVPWNKGKKIKPESEKYSTLYMRKYKKDGKNT